MQVTRRARSVLAFAVAGGVSALLGMSRRAVALQPPGDPVIQMNASDANSTTSTSLNSAGHWASGAAPTAGNAYVNEAYQFRTPASLTTNAYNFRGDSLTAGTLAIAGPGSNLGAITANTGATLDLAVGGASGNVANGGIFDAKRGWFQHRLGDIVLGNQPPESFLTYVGENRFCRAFCEESRSHCNPEMNTRKINAMGRWMDDRRAGSVSICAGEVVGVKLFG